jgi:fermentation-respiration switch protein FrsA (DUF1100 family)
VLADRMVLIFVVAGCVILTVATLWTVLSWVLTDAAARGGDRWVPAALFVGPAVVLGAVLAFRHAGPILIGIAVLGLPLIGIIIWLSSRPRLQSTPSGLERLAAARTALKRRLAWLCSSAVLFTATVPFAVSFLIAGAARRSPMWRVMYDPSAPHLIQPSGRRAEMLKGVANDPKIDLGLDFEDVEFAAVDGKQLRGWFVPGQRTASIAVVLVHGADGDRRMCMRSLPIFHTMGYPALLFDCRNHGASGGDGQGITLGVNESRDVSSAVQFLRRTRGFAHVVVFGVSQGAASALLAAGHDEHIEGVIGDSPFSSFDDLIGVAARRYGLPTWLARGTVEMANWRLDVSSVGTPLQAVEHISPRPILLMHGTGDSLIPHSASQALFDHAGQPKHLWLAPDAGHGGISFKYPQEYRQRITEFLQAYFPLRSDAE